MQTAELKTSLIDRINSINDDHLLMEAIRLINIEIQNDEEKFVFSESQTSKIMNAIKEIENGDYLTSNDANIEIEQWLRE
ncbi:MAG: hypothetical protein RIR48_2451 [Bacteroidota bacterium]|jgi:hypothetical protein